MGFRETRLRLRIESESDFIACKRFDFSLSKLIERYPDGAPNKIIAQALMMDEDQVEEMYEEVVLKMRLAMKVDVDF